MERNRFILDVVKMFQPRIRENGVSQRRSSRLDHILAPFVAKSFAVHNVPVMSHE